MATVRDWTIDSASSSIVVEARSSMGPIAWEVLGPEGEFQMAVEGGVILVEPTPTGSLRIELDQFRSGNELYDAELAKRLDVRRHPRAEVRLTSATRTGAVPLQVSADMTLHGETRALHGTLEMTFNDDRVDIVGVQELDIRHFGIPAPQMLMLKIFPDVRVHLFLRGTLVHANSND